MFGNYELQHYILVSTYSIDVTLYGRYAGTKINSVSILYLTQLPKLINPQREICVRLP